MSEWLDKTISSSRDQLRVPLTDTLHSRFPTPQSLENTAGKEHEPDVPCSPFCLLWFCPWKFRHFGRLAV